MSSPEGLSAGESCVAELRFHRAASVRRHLAATCSWDCPFIGLQQARNWHPKLPHTEPCNAMNLAAFIKANQRIAILEVTFWELPDGRAAGDG